MAIGYSGRERPRAFKSSRSQRRRTVSDSKRDDVPNDIPSGSIPSDQRMMIVPSFWAEARAQYRRKGKQITVRRFGWSDTSEEDAQRNARARVDEALARAISGEPLPRRERKVPYNGGNGLPIREEVVARFDDTVITRLPAMRLM